MPISVECPGCGRKFQAPDKLAGKPAKCPKCSVVIEVGTGLPQSSGTGVPGEDAGQPIPVTCGCGKKFRAKVELAGKRAKCPACGQALVIPSVGSAAGAAPTDSLDFDQLMAAETAAAPSTLCPSKRKTDGSNTRLILGLSIATGAGVLVLLLVALLWPSGENEKLAKQGAQPGTQPSEAVEASLSPSAAPPGAADVVPAAPTGEPAPAATAAARTYPSFPDAVAEVPPWNDVEPPFDLAEFLKAPPDEENAAPLYLDALFEFDSELSICYCLSGEEPQGETKRPQRPACRSAVWSLESMRSSDVSY